MTLNFHYSLVAAILVLFFGKYLNQKVAFLREYNIPSPVSGGLAVALGISLLYATTGLEVSFSLEQRNTYLIMFFTSLGLSTRFATLRQGGWSLVILLVGAIGCLVLQNLAGAGMAKLLGQPLAIGVLGGSVALSGGHGTAIAWANDFVEHYGIPNAMEIGIACATFGLVLGGVVGGPLAHWLIKRHQLQATSDQPITVGFRYNSHAQIDVDSVLWVLLKIGIAVAAGLYLRDLLQSLGLQLPTFVTCLFSGIVVSNVLPLLIPTLPRVADTPTLALISDLTLGLFLSLSLISIQLWTLVDLALPILLLLAVQVVVVVLFSVLVIFRILGSNYEAAVMVGGYTGLALGATPTAIANMTAITEKFGAAPRAFILVPLVGAFFLDVSNALVIKAVLSWLYA